MIGEGSRSEVYEEMTITHESENLLHKAGPYEWTPLMYALRFKPDDVKSILSLIAKCPPVCSRKRYIKPLSSPYCSGFNDVKLIDIRLNDIIGQ